MFNSSLKNDALAIHQKEVDKYNNAYETMLTSCDRLYQKRLSSVDCIDKINMLINSIANTPKDFEKKIESIKKERDKFTENRKYVKESMKSTVESGVGIFGAIGAGGVFAGVAPNIAMSIATTFGTASTGTAISSLSGAAATKAALAWLGGGVLQAGGGGMAAGQALLALAGPIGWGIAAAGTGVSLISLSLKNKKIADNAVDEAQKIAKLRSSVVNTNEKISNLIHETELLLEKLNCQYSDLSVYESADYTVLTEDIQIQLGTLVNNTLSLSELINKTVQ